MAKLRPIGHFLLADQFNQAHEIPLTFFSSTTFPTVDSSATTLAVTYILSYKSHGIWPSSSQAVVNSALD